MHLPVAEPLRAPADLRCVAGLNEGAHSGGGGNPSRPCQLGAADHRRNVRTGERRRDRPHRRRRQGPRKEPFDALLDIVIADELRTGLSPRPFGDDEADWKARAECVAPPRCSDRRLGRRRASRHDVRRDLHDVAAGHGVREHQVVTLEEAVRLITDVPARLYGLKERGRIAEGWHADLVMFDPLPSTTDRNAPATTYPLAHHVWWPTQKALRRWGGRCRGVPRRQPRARCPAPS